LKRGGALNIVYHAIQMWVPADDIPEAVTVDLTGLDFNDSVHISAIALPKGAKPTNPDKNFTVASISPPAGGAEEPAPAAAAPAPAKAAAKAPAPKK
jgi:large subunit ribosomal protein L25